MKHHKNRSLHDLNYHSSNLHRHLSIGATLAITIVSLWMSAYLWYGATPRDLNFLINCSIIITALLSLRCTWYLILGLFDTKWRYTSPVEALTISFAHFISTLLVTLIILSTRLSDLPLTIIIGECPLSILLAFSGRVSVRTIVEHLHRQEKKGINPPRDIIIIGAGISGHLFVRTILSQPRLNYRPIAFLDDSPSLSRTRIHGVPVIGPLSSLRSALNKHQRVVAVIIAIPGISSLKLQEIKATCDEFFIPTKHLQSYEEIALAENLEQKTRITVEEVLNRDERQIVDPRILNHITGTTVLVTGAGGSIGSELVRQLLALQPQEIILLDKNEYNLYAIDQEIKDSFNSVNKIPVLATVVDEKRLDNIFAQYRPDTVFHAAAYKHVPLLETNCYEAFTNNVIGTRNLLAKTKIWGVENFILISSDKAVDPSSVMGATKRVKELMVGDVNNYFPPRDSQHEHLHTAVVRFGNVINSSGSVIPLFKKQILAGLPLTVTHPDMERYFMSIREAVRLVLTAGTLGQDGEIFLLDMGRPLRIVDVAKKLRALYGRRDLPIVFTGLREGEKLTEILYSESETTHPTEFNKIFAVYSNYDTEENVYSWVDKMSKELYGMKDEDIGREIHRFVSSGGKTIIQEDVLPHISHGWSSEHHHVV